MKFENYIASDGLGSGTLRYIEKYRKLYFKDNYKENWGQGYGSTLFTTERKNFSNKMIYEYFE